MYDNSPRKGAKPRILFVDDSRLMRFAGQRFLIKHFDVVLAEDGRQAWKILQRDDSIRFVITDLMMPGIDGIELIRRIRDADHERVRALPVLVITSVEEKTGRRRALDAGATDLVPKPFSGTDLVEPVSEYFNRFSEPKVSGPHAFRLPNLERERSSFIRRLDQINSFHDRHAMEFSILHAQLDDYDQISSSFGLSWAESMMRHVERVLAREVRVEDTIGRTDDAVISMVLMATPTSGAKKLRDRLRERLARNPARFPGRSMHVKLSFSIQCPGGRDSHSAGAILEAGLARLSEPANVTRLSDRIKA